MQCNLVHTLATLMQSYNSPLLMTFGLQRCDSPFLPKRRVRLMRRFVNVEAHVSGMLPWINSD